MIVSATKSRLRCSVPDVQPGKLRYGSRRDLAQDRTPVVAILSVRTLQSAGYVLVALTLSAVLGGCATTLSQRATADDPLEPLNRVVFDFNANLDKAFIKPIAEGYRRVVPQSMRDRIRAAIDNLAEPRIFANDLLQGRADAAGITFKRFFINTTVGLAGLFDVATEKGLPKQSGDFGQTLYAWGVDHGPYLVLLFFGPSNVRDAFGLGVDLFTTPPGVFVPGHAGVVTGFVVGTVDGIDLRSRNIETLDEIIASSLDYYAHLKSIAQQRREAELREGRGAPPQPQELIDPELSPGTK
jgi:phospholipid-binding lipoprotein MlaA